MEAGHIGFRALRHLCERKEDVDIVAEARGDGDETEDQYVMRACFSTDRDDIIVRVYYGDVTEEMILEEILRYVNDNPDNELEWILQQERIN